MKNIATEKNHVMKNMSMSYQPDDGGEGRDDGDIGESRDGAELWG